MTTLRTWSPHDTMLGTVAPLALGVAAGGPALVIDLEPEGLRYPGDASLARLVADGPRREDLVPPHRRSVAVLPNGGVDEADATEVIDALIAGWPNVVLRVGQCGRPGGRGVVVPVFPLGPAAAHQDTPAVYQRGPWPADRSLEGIVLPRPRATTVRSLLEGRRPMPCRWLRTWRGVWSYPWP
jgi:hypothetical protein